VLTELSGAGTGLERLLAAWQLSVTEAAELFGVSRQAVQQWLDGGVPSSRQPKLLVILQIADLLERNLEPSRIPGAVRAPAGAYRGRSFVEVIAADRHREVLDRVAASFDWAATA
jgi:predicted XRE-type DNA-binding protein